MTITIEPTTDPGTGIIRWPGQLVVGNRQTLKSLAFKSSNQNLIVDLTNTGYVDASGLGILIKICHRLRDAGKRLVVIGLSDDLDQLFELTKINTVIHTAADEDEALDLLARAEINDTPPPTERKHYHDNDLLEFEDARVWWGCSASTLERMNLPWSFPTRAKGGGRLRRIMFKDLVAHYERRKVG